MNLRRAVFLSVLTLGAGALLISGCAAPRAIGKAAGGVVRTTGKVASGAIKTTGKAVGAVTAPLRSGRR